MQRISILFIIPLWLLGATKLFAADQEASVKIIAPDSVNAGENFQITVRIVKGSNTSFAKLQLEMPPQFVFDSLDSEGARFIQDENQAKYIWDRMPQQDTLLVKFAITTDPDFSGIKGVNGLFAYISNEEKEEITIPAKLIKILSPVLTAVVDDVRTQENDHSELIKTPEELIEEIEAEATPPTKPTVVNKVKPSQAKSSTLKATLIEFRIQIVASSSKMNVDKLKSKFSISDKVRAELHNSLWKYTVGSYRTYNDAKAVLPTYRNDKGVIGAFITAYQDGQRIGVRSAINQTK